MEEELIQYYIVNSELGMSGPKTSTQTAHGATMAAMKYYRHEVFRRWFGSGQKKIVLRGKLSQLEKFEADGYIAVRDNGHTEVPPNSLTCIVLPVMTREEAKAITKRYQLLKD
jgi:PTH2 family peptidyl-tRNA hydrolase